MGSLRRTRPATLEDLTIQVAIVRPGPIVGGAVNPYIERLQRLRERPGLRGALRPPVAGAGAARDARHDHLPGPGDRGRAGVRGLLAGRGRGAAPGDERASARRRRSRRLPRRLRRGRAMARIGRRRRGAAERVWSMVVGFSGFGFPKAHGAAFGLLAYQSTWLRVHYGPEFLCSLLDEQPMGFYPPDALVHEAQRRGIEVLPPDVNAQRRRLHGDRRRRGPGRPGLRPRRARRRGRRAGRRARGRRAVPLARRPRRARGRRPRRRSSSSPGRAPATRSRAAIAAARCGRSASRPGAQVGALAPSPVGSPRWRRRPTPPASPRRPPPAAPQTPRRRRGRDAALAAARAARRAGAPARSSAGTSMIADYATTGLTTGAHPLGLLRDELRGEGMVASGDLERAAPRRRACGSAASSSPASARAPPRACVFLLLEDEDGTVNLVVPPQVYERDRLAVRTEPLVVAEGRLERHASGGGAINVARRRSAGARPRPAASEAARRGRAPAATSRTCRARRELAPRRRRHRRLPGRGARRS